MHNGQQPKVLLPIMDKPMILHVLSAVDASGCDARPIVVLGQHANAVRAVLPETARVVLQAEPRGTGHAVQAAIAALPQPIHIPTLVLYGDHPLLTGGTINNMIETHQRHSATITLTTVRARMPWDKHFSGNGRIVRDAQQRIVKIVEHHDASPEQLAITERNASYLCFRSDWLWKHIAHLTDDNAQKEYYLTDLIDHAVARREPIASVEIAPIEALGINTPAEFEQVAAL